MPAAWCFDDPDRARMLDSNPPAAPYSRASARATIFSGYAAPAPTPVESPVPSVPSSSKVLILDTDEEELDAARTTDYDGQEHEQISTHSSDVYYDSSHENACLEYIRLEEAREDIEKGANSAR